MTSTLEYTDTALDQRDFFPPPLADPPATSERAVRSRLAAAAGHRVTWVVAHRRGRPAGPAGRPAHRLRHLHRRDQLYQHRAQRGPRHGVRRSTGCPSSSIPRPASACTDWSSCVFGMHGGTEHTLFALRQVDAVLGAGHLCDHLPPGRPDGPSAGGHRGRPVARHRSPGHQLRQPGHARGTGPVGGGRHVLLHGGGRRRRTTPVQAPQPGGLAGLVGGVAISTKETFGLVVLLALVCLLMGGWVTTSREAAKVIAIALVVYVVTIFADASFFGIGVWWNAKVDRGPPPGRRLSELRVQLARDPRLDRCRGWWPTGPSSG